MSMTISSKFRILGAYLVAVGLAIGIVGLQQKLSYDQETLDAKNTVENLAWGCSFANEGGRQPLLKLP